MREAVYCGTRNIYSDMETAAKSLVANSKVDRVWFVIEDREFPTKLPDIFEIVDMGNQQIFPSTGPNYKSGFTYMAMMRLALAYVLPEEVHKVLSIDGDTVVFKDVTAIWDLPIGDSYLAAAKEWERSEPGKPYHNFGVVLYNLDALRDGKARECIEELNRKQYTWTEQDVGNELCSGRIFEMPGFYNSNRYTDKCAPNPSILHYAAYPRSEWANLPEVTRWRETPWKDVMAMHEERS